LSDNVKPEIIIRGKGEMGNNMVDVKINIKSSLNDIISAIQALDPEEREFFIENLLAATSPEYLDSIKEARRDYQAGHVTSHEELFGQARKT